MALNKDIGLFLVDIILDSRKPDDIAGLRFVETIREIPKYQFVPVIIITQLYDEAFTAFHNLHCYGYVEKPYDGDKLRRLIESALKVPLNNSESRQFLYYRKDGVLFSVECAEIMYIEANLRKVNIYSKNDEVTIPYRTIASIIADLPSSLFVQCHRHAIVNRRFIDSIDKPNRIITLKNGTKIDIGRKYLNEITD